MMAAIDRDPESGEKYSVDQWPGYDVSRKRMMDLLAKPYVSNPIVLTGDIHANYVNDLKVNCGQTAEQTVATEFVGTSISSGGDGALIPEGHEGIMRDNPCLHFHSKERGYVQCEVTPENWETKYQAVPYVSKKGAPLVTRATFQVENGRRGAQQI